ncbi:MAG TPA: BON domain-containing protein [Thermoleophilaceae bacterium]
MRRTSKELERLGRRAAREVDGTVQRVRHLRSEPKPDMDDVTLARKVETVLFRRLPDVKGHVNINVVDHVVVLHGQAKNPTRIRQIESIVRGIPEVTGIESNLHLPKTPARTRADSPGARKGGTRKTSKPRDTGKRFNAEKTPAEPGDTPAEVAAGGSGRRAAPLGSTGDEETEPDSTA